MPVRSHKGYRSNINEIARLPAWARSLLTLLRALSANTRQNTLHTLKFLSRLLESEWTDLTDANGATASATVPLEVPDNDDDESVVIKRERSKTPSWKRQRRTCEHPVAASSKR